MKAEIEAGFPPVTNECRVYWGSHGCDYERGHDGDHECGCCECVDHPDPGPVWCVAKPPYYGEMTTFYGDDAAGFVAPGPSGDPEL